MVPAAAAVVVDPQTYQEGLPREGLVGVPVQAYQASPCQEGDQSWEDPWGLLGAVGAAPGDLRTMEQSSTTASNLKYSSHIITRPSFPIIFITGDSKLECQGELWVSGYEFKFESCCRLLMYLL